MKRPRCPRSWEVEAARDGRLTGDALERSAGHVRQCAWCTEEARYVEGLVRRLRQTKTPEIDDLSLRRLRERVLDRADAELSGRSVGRSREGRRVAALALFAAAMIAASALVFGRRSPSGSAIDDVVVSTTETAGTRWTKRMEGGVLHIELAEGTLRVRTQGRAPGEHVVVHVPDAEIADVGTTFVVAVREGRLSRVSVEEGLVTVRVANVHAMILASGQAWERAAPPPTASSPTGDFHQASPSATATERRHGPRPSPEPQSFAGGGRLPGGSARQGPSAGAPSSTAEEDAAYLRVIGFARARKASSASEAAREYLRRFPLGFRREEMEQLAKP